MCKRNHLRKYDESRHALKLFLGVRHSTLSKVIFLFISFPLAVLAAYEFPFPEPAER